jgi:hypothetical protein
MDADCAAMFLCCSCCDKTWATREDFLADGELILNGYQVDFSRPETGFLLFTHHREDCGSTLALEVQRFADLYRGPGHDLDLHGTTDCSGLCGRTENLMRCDRKCRNAWVRDLVAVIMEGRRQPAGDAAEQIPIDRIAGPPMISVGAEGTDVRARGLHRKDL